AAGAPGSQCKQSMFTTMVGSAAGMAPPEQVLIGDDGAFPAKDRKDREDEGLDNRCLQPQDLPRKETYNCLKRGRDLSTKQKCCYDLLQGPNSNSGAREYLVQCVAGKTEGLLVIDPFNAPAFSVKITSNCKKAAN